MTIEIINQNTFVSTPIFYSRWHNCATSERGRHFDILIGELVGNIINISENLFVICTYLTKLVDLGDDDYKINNGFKIWEINAGTMYLEDKSGIRYLGCIESLIDLGEEGLKVTGTSCLFTDSFDNAVIDSFFIIRDLIPKKDETVAVDFDYSDAINYIKSVEPIIKDILPERFI
jgi:hypothetical protein